MRKILLILLFQFCFWIAFTQTVKNVKLVECYNYAIKADPLNAKKSLLASSTSLHLEKLEISKMPNISWQALASIQTEVIEFPFEFPGTTPIELPLYKFQTYLDANYTIYDGDIVEAQKEIEQAKLITEQYALTAELDKHKKTVNSYYFGILLTRAKEKVFNNSLDNIRSKIQYLEAGLKHGVVLESEVDKLKVELLRLHAEIEKIQANELALIRSLSQLTEVTFDTSTQFQLPYLQNFENDGSNERKEFQLFELQKQNILANEKLITAVRKPKVAAFVQAGIGYPNPLNFFDESLSPYALGGVRFQWQFVDWKKDEKDRQLLSVQTQMIDNQKVSFERKINLLNGKFKEDVAAFENQLKRDEEIQDLQKKILLSLSSQLDNGVITVTEFIHQVNAGIQTQLNLELHKLQLIQTKVNYLTLKGLL